MRRLIALLICTTLVASGCATGGAPRVQAPASPVDAGLLASYVKQLPIGSRVRVTLTDGHSVRGTLMQASETAIVVQRRTRVPEPPETLALAGVAAVEVDSGGGGPAKAIWAGAAAGAGGALAFLLILAALFAND